MISILRKNKEYVLYFFLWAIVFLAPVLSMYINVHSGRMAQYDFHLILKIWSGFALYIVAFFIHDFWLAPLLVYKDRKVLYFTLTFLLVVVFFFANYLQRPSMPQGPKDKEQQEWGPRTDGATAPNSHVIDYSQVKRVEKRNDTVIEYVDIPDEPNDKHHHHGGGRFLGPPILEMSDFIGCVVLILLFGMNLSVKLYIKSSEEEKKRREAEQRHLEEQLAYLRYQINPHFFMNTLNNIHALIDINPEKAKEIIVVLSRLMRYLLYEGDHILVPLDRELTFLNYYISLMKIRYTKRVSIMVDIPDELPDAEVPPQVLVTFVENAFKHGVSYQQDSFVYVELSADDNHLTFRCTNSKLKNKPDKTVNTPGGVGLVNVRRRLQLIYDTDYDLQINDGDTQYEVSLTLPLRPANYEQLMQSEHDAHKEHDNQKNTPEKD